MPYIGNPPAEKYASYDVQHITTSATSSYVLDKNVANENEIRVVLNNIIQQPGSSYAYTASGNTLTLSAATTSSDKLYVVFTGKAVQTVTPPPSSVGLAQFNATGSPGTNTFLRGDNSWATPSDTSLTLNNNAANRVVAGTGTTNTMDAQAGLIFDGSKLGIGATPTLALDISSTDPRIYMIDTTNAGSTYKTKFGQYNDTFLISTNDGANDAIKIYATGEVIKPLQPTFLVNVSSDSVHPNLPTGVTVINFGSKAYDVGTNVSNVGVFTAPVTGKYQFNTSMAFAQITSSTTLLEVFIKASNREMRGCLQNVANLQAGDYQSFGFSTMVDMDASDTCFVQVAITGGGGTIDVISGSTSAPLSFFSGTLIC